MKKLLPAVLLLAVLGAYSYAAAVLPLTAGPALVIAAGLVGAAFALLVLP